MRGGSRPGILGQNHPPPTFPRRGPRRQQRASPRCTGPHVQPPQTRDYVQRQGTKSRTKKEILRLLKRAIAREVFRLLTRPGPIDDYSDLRPSRQAKNLTLATVAHHFGVPIITVSRLER